MQSLWATGALFRCLNWWAGVGAAATMTVCAINTPGVVLDLATI